jgi:hypothetical protein
VYGCPCAAYFDDYDITDQVPPPKPSDNLSAQLQRAPEQSRRWGLAVL